MKNLIRKLLSKTSSLFLFRKRNQSAISKKAKFTKCHFLYCINNNIEIGNSKFVNCNFRIHGSNNRLKIGDGCLFDNVDFYISDGSSIIIKDNTRVFGYTHLASCENGKLEIGNDCLISSNVNIRNTDSHSIIDLKGKRLNYGKDVLIGNHIWICNNATILKGSVIKENSIIGNSSLVNKEFNESNVVICGSPASIKKRDVTWVDKKIS